jgi:hypothetical protein
MDEKMILSDDGKLVGLIASLGFDQRNVQTAWDITRYFPNDLAKDNVHCEVLGNASTG